MEVTIFTETGHGVTKARRKTYSLRGSVSPWLVSAEAAVHQRRMALREPPQCFDGQSPVGVGAAEAPRPRAEIAACQSELEILVSRARS